MKKQNMVVGFADLTNFAKLVDAVGSEQAIAFLQDAFKIAGDSIIKFGGQIRKYIGDTILFTFTDARQAICAAKEISSVYRRTVNSLTLRYNVAVATGEVLVGQIGHPSYLVEDVMGEVVNRAAILVKEAAKNEAGIALDNETKKYE
jgi:class 3 adenylate cyclase